MIDLNTNNIRAVKSWIRVQNINDPTTLTSTYVLLGNTLAPVPNYKYLLDEFYNVSNVENLVRYSMIQNINR